MAGILGNRLIALPAPRPLTKCYRISDQAGKNIALTLDFAPNQVILDGPGAPVESCTRLIQALDSLDEVGGRNTRLVPLRTSKPASIRSAMAAIDEAGDAQQPHMPLATMLFQGQDKTGTQPAGGKKEPRGREKPRVGLVNPVEIESLEGLDVLILRGKAQDVQQVIEIINQIERVSAETMPAVEVLPLRYADCQTMGPMLRSLYDEVYLSRQGEVSITAVVKPNALLIVGRPENVQTVVDLTQKLDQPVAPDTQFRVFQLRHATAAAVQATILDFYKDRGGLGPQVRVTTDVRSNALLIQAGPRDMDELAAMIARIDTPSAAAVNELRIIQLEHSLAKDLVEVLQSAIGVAVGDVRGGAPAGGAAATPSENKNARAQGEQRSAMLRFLTIDARGRRLVESGILTNVQVTSDVRANAIVVSAPPECMELIETLIRRLDALPAAEAQIKVFTIVNSDAASLKDMLETLFTGQAAGGPSTAPAGTEGSLVALRFAVDARTNSIIASGSAAELTVVEAILMRLDDSEVQHRKNYVFRLKNSYATYVASAINEFLTSQRQMQREQTPGMVSAFEQIEREVVVVPEVVSNSLILSATPRFFDEVKGIIEQLDKRPPMVMIQVLIAEVELGNMDEFGVELGLQDGLLFDRSLLSNIEKITNTVTNPNQTTQTTEHIVAADNTPGFNFNNTSPLGNSGALNSIANAALMGGQGLSNFSVGRVGQSGFGGLVLSASSESISILLRALSACNRVEVLQRPQIMTMDNQPAYILVGQKVPIVTNINTNQVVGQNFSTEYRDVGTILGVTPRISPDGLVGMEIDAIKSKVGPESEGTVIAVSEGQPIRSPRIDTITAQTTVSAADGQTVVLGGLITKNKAEFHRKVPWLGDIPLVGRLFRFDSVSEAKRELLIIMTPHIVSNEAEADAIKQSEAARMSWCLGEVAEMYGDVGLRGRTDEWSDAETQVIYPDMKPVIGPDGEPFGPEMIPVPEGVPAENPK